MAPHELAVHVRRGEIVFRGILLDLINESGAVSAEAMDGGWTRRGIGAGFRRGRANEGWQDG